VALQGNPLTGVFFFLAAVALAVAPLPILFRNLGILLIAYLAFALSKAVVSYIVVMFAPPLGLFSGSPEWLTMQPLMISSGLLAVLGLEFAWRYPALVVSPLLCLMPYFFAWQLSQYQLFAVALPFEPSAPLWLILHGLVSVGGVLVALYLNRRQERPRRR
jgi:hypothetical protein